MLDKSTLKLSLEQAFKDQREKETDWEAAVDDLCTKISDAVDAFIKSATIVYTSGLVAPNGAVTGTFEGELQ